MEPRQLEILKQIAAGRSYGDILAACPGLTLPDIFAAAGAAVAALVETPYAQRLAAIKRANPRAYSSWSAGEDALLLQMADAGHTSAEMSAALQRQTGAITSRLAKFNWMPPEGSQP